MSQNYDQYKQMVLAGQYNKAQEEPDVAEELFNGTALTEKKLQRDSQQQEIRKRLRTERKSPQGDAGLR